jgi:TolB protein
MTVVAARAADDVFPGQKGRIAFQRFVGSNSDIFTMTAGGKHLRPLAASPGADEASPAWSPNGQWLAFERHPGKADETLSDVFIIDAKGGHLRRVTKARGFDGDPAWSSTGHRIVFESGRAGNREIFSIDVASRQETRLTKNPAFDGQPVWSPRGRRIAFTSNRDGNREVYLMNPDGSSLLNLTRSRSDDFDPSWSPSGQFVVFTSTRSGRGDIYLTNDRFQLLQLTSGSTFDSNPTFSPDGKQIVFARQTVRGTLVDRDLYVMSATGDNPRLLYRSRGWDVAPDYQARRRPLAAAVPARSPVPAGRLAVGAKYWPLRQKACVIRRLRQACSG